MKKKQLTDSQRAATVNDLKKRIHQLVDDIPAFADECLQRLIDSEYGDIVGEDARQAIDNLTDALLGVGGEA